MVPSLKDLFAMAAIQGLCANPGANWIDAEYLARVAWKTADAMMNAKKAAPSIQFIADIGPVQSVGFVADEETERWDGMA